VRYLIYRLGYQLRNGKIRNYVKDYFESKLGYLTNLTEFRPLSLLSLLPLILITGILKLVTFPIKDSTDLKTLLLC